MQCQFHIMGNFSMTSEYGDFFISKYQQDVTPQYFYFLFCHSLHVSGTFHAHHQEISKLTAYATSGKVTVLCGRLLMMGMERTRNM
jgi:hypothetical protein